MTQSHCECSVYIVPLFIVPWDLRVRGTDVNLQLLLPDVLDLINYLNPVGLACCVLTDSIYGSMAS